MSTTPTPAPYPPPRMKVSATIKTDDGIEEGTFDAAPWFYDDQTTDADFAVLAQMGWGRCATADAIVYICQEQRAVARIIEYIETECPKRLVDGVMVFVGFEVSVNQREAMLWLREYRYRLWTEIRQRAIEDATPDPSSQPTKPAPTRPARMACGWS